MQNYASIDDEDKPQERPGFLTSIRWAITEIPSNLRSGATVALVNIPLSIALSIAGGGTPVAGIVTAFWSGLVAALFGGSEFNIVGPTGALSGILTAAATAHTPAVLPWLALWTGVLSLIVYRFKLVDYLMFIPNSVVHGFTVGVAIIIGFGQYDNALGLSFKHTSTDFYLKLGESFYNTPQLMKQETTLFFLVNFIALFVLLPKYPMVPWAVILTIIGIFVGMFNGQPGDMLYSLTTLEKKYGDLSLQMITLPSLDVDVFNKNVIYSSIAVAFIAVLETLISARLADEMTKTHHDRQKEVLGLSLANIASGLCGGIPATAALARTSLNVKTGATSRVSAMVGAFFLYILASVLIPYFKFVPMATIAAILGVLSCRMVDVHQLEILWKYDKVGFGISFITAVMCVVDDTMSGLVIGSLLSMFVYLHSFSKGYVEVTMFAKGAKPSAESADDAAAAATSLDRMTSLLFSPAKAATTTTTTTTTNGADLLMLRPQQAEPQLIASVDVEALDHLTLPALLDALLEKFQQDNGRSEGHGQGGEGAGRTTIFAATEASSIAPTTAIANVARGRRHHRDRQMPLEDVHPSAVTPLLNTCHVLLYRIAGQLSYVNALAHAARASKLVELGLGDNLHSAVIALDAVWMLDLDGVQALQEIVEEFSRSGLRVFLAGVHLVNTTGAVRPSFKGDMSQHGLGLASDASPDRSQRSKSFRGIGPLIQDHVTTRPQGSSTDGSNIYGEMDRSSDCLPPTLLASLPSGGGAHTATVTVTKLLTQQAFYQELLRRGTVFADVDDAVMAASVAGPLPFIA